MLAPLKTLAFMIAATGTALLGTTPAVAGPLPYAAGIVQADGTVLSGFLFTVAHPGTGQYTVTYPSSAFASVPAMTVTAFGTNANKIAIPVVFSEKKAHGQIVFTILMSSTAGQLTPVDNGFQFTIVVT
jgi:hypothetical protein